MTNYDRLSGNVIKCTFSYLQSRSLCVIIDSLKSKRFDFNQGVPQGACLGPVLFTDLASPVFNFIHASGKTLGVPVRHVAACLSEVSLWCPCLSEVSLSLCSRRRC